MNLPSIFHAWLGLAVLLCGTSQAQRHAPRFSSMDEAFRRVAKERPVSRFPGREEGLEHTLVLLCDADARPLMFYADVTTPVCIDNVCEPVRVGLYWDLLGEYVGYGVPADCPLLKYDHLPFTPGDYLKLHQVLCDGESILGSKPLTELFDPNSPTDKRNLTGAGQRVDAVTGATSKDILRAVVPGALFSCHALWHLAHRDAAQPMADSLEPIYDADLASRFLDSENPGYQRYAVEKMDGRELDEHLTRVLQIVRQAEPDARASILRKLPRPIWQQEPTTRCLYCMFAALDAEMKTLLIERLDQADECAAEILADQVASMTKKQLQGYLAFLAGDRGRLSGPIEARLRQVAAAERYAYCYVVDAFLRETSSADRAAGDGDQP